MIININIIYVNIIIISILLLPMNIDPYVLLTNIGITYGYRFVGITHDYRFVGTIHEHRGNTNGPKSVDNTYELIFIYSWIKLLLIILCLVNDVHIN